MSELIKTRPPVEPQQYISLGEFLGDYENYYLTVDHEHDNVIVWMQEYRGASTDIDREFTLADLKESVAWLKTAEADTEHAQEDLGEWVRQSERYGEGSCYLRLPCGDTVETNIRDMERLIVALTAMTTTEEWAGVPE